MARRGRPQNPGPRKHGRPVSALPYDHGADHVIQLRSRFAKFQNGKAAQQVFDPIGRAWAVGLLENPHVDPACLRDAGRDYASRYWGYYPTASGVANYDGSLRIGNRSERREERFRTIDKTLLDAGRKSYDAAQDLCVSPYWSPDENPDWIERLINERLLRVGESVSGQLPRPEDRTRLTLAMEGLLALTGDQRQVA